MTQPLFSQIRNADDVARASSNLSELDSLALHPGWRLFQSWLRIRLETTTAQLSENPSLEPHQIARIAGDIGATRLMTKWLEMQQQGMAASIQQAKERLDREAKKGR